MLHENFDRVNDLIKVPVDRTCQSTNQMFLRRLEDNRRISNNIRVFSRNVEGKSVLYLLARAALYSTILELVQVLRSFQNLSVLVNVHLNALAAGKYFAL
jgi:hypothetical protein